MRGGPPAHLWSKMLVLPHAILGRLVWVAENVSATLADGCLEAGA